MKRVNDSKLEANQLAAQGGSAPFKPQSPSENLDPAKLFDILYPADKDSEQVPEPMAHTPASAFHMPPVAVEKLGLMAHFNRLLDFVQSLPRDEALSLLIDVKATLEPLLKNLSSEVPPLPTAKNNYPRYTQAGAHGGKKIDPYDWLKQYWGRWLKHFTPGLSRDYLFLDQLGILDPELKNALYAKRRSILKHTGLKISQIVPKKSVRLDYEIEDADPEQLKQAVRTYVLPRVRKSKS